MKRLILAAVAIYLIIIIMGCDTVTPVDVDSAVDHALGTTTSSDSTVPVVSPTPTPTPTPPKPSTSPSVITEKVFNQKVFDIVAGSKCSKYRWKDRGVPPEGYLKGIGLTYAKNVCRPNSIVSSGRSVPESKYDRSDVLSWYNSDFKSLGYQIDLPGRSTQRHVWSLIIGLGMRESSGKYCTGRDASAENTSSETAEAGLMQQSYNSRVASPELVTLYNKYKSSKKGCYLEVFKEGATCKASYEKLFGTGEGLTFQILNKSCPSFAAEYAAILVRKSGGTKGHYGPLRTKKAELNKDCDNMLLQIENLTLSNFSICDQI